MQGTPQPARPDELGTVVDLLVAQQQRPDRCCTYLGDQRDGLLAELDDCTPPWTTTLRVVHEDDGAVRGAALVDVNAELGRAWVLGPWSSGGDEQWTADADDLVSDVLAHLPTEVDDIELAGDVRHELLADLAGRLGWPASDVNHALVATSSTIATWPEPDTSLLRRARRSDLAAVAPLHDRTFPATHTSVAALLDPDGDHRVIVAESDGAVLGYAAGQVHPDGEGFLDFVAVAESVRGQGLGRRLVMAATRQLLAASTTGRVCLTVEDRRTVARGLYDALGFTRELSMISYRTRPAT